MKRSVMRNRLTFNERFMSPVSSWWMSIRVRAKEFVGKIVASADTAHFELMADDFRHDRLFAALVTRNHLSCLIVRTELLRRASGASHNGAGGAFQHVMTPCRFRPFDHGRGLAMGTLYQRFLRFDLDGCSAIRAIDRLDFQDSSPPVRRGAITSPISELLRFMLAQ